jgi:hypothetical protein
MAKKIKNPEIIFDFPNEEDLDICGFSDAPIEGKCIATFSCTNNNSDSEIKQSDQEQLNSNDNPTVESVPVNSIFSNSSDQITHANAVTPVTFITTASEKNSKAELDNSANINSSNKLNSNDDTLFDNRNLPIVNGCAPPIDGEYLDVKRTYMLRKSTVRKINKLKSIHPELNTYVSTIVDSAIAFYYEHIVNDSNT